ncbi:hypothetical protein, partial [Klebsiella pneumoniae]|uniref:hypothetical protein n=1 Tax=Klebsiella pneumoniae TaxID=573 RepID=UPI00188717C7
GKKSAQIREILISESAWEEMTCLFAPSLAMSAMKKNPGMYDNGQFFAPGHHGYRQYATILKKQKDAAGLDALLKKKKAEGWAD